jgi:hypothetical protein
MRYVDRPFAAAVTLFLLGSLLGAFLVIVLPSIRGPIISLLQVRLITPMNMVSQFGNGALLLLVFLNNSIPAGLSFAYPFIIARVSWTPALTRQRTRQLLTGFTWLCAFLVGFFGLGVALSIGWVLGGKTLLFTMLSGAWVHGPVELVAVLLCVSEPLRLAGELNGLDLTIRLQHDMRLLLICLSGIAVSAAIEVFTRV